jgi:hypothetical protein
VVAALLFGHAVHRGAPVGIAASIVLGACAAWVGALGRRLYRERGAGLSRAEPRALLGVAGVTLLAAVVAVGELLGST